MFRPRRAQSPRAAGFLAVLEVVERAKAAAVSAVPDRRGRARPLADALFEFDAELQEARALLSGWAEGDSSRAACEAGLAESLRRSEALRMEAPDLGYESLVARLAELLDPLDAFEHAAHALLGRS